MTTDGPIEMNTNNQKQTAPSRHEVWRMFDRIAGRYDLLNHLLSANRDKKWRQKLTTLLPEGDTLEVLDLATGTADQLLALYRTGRVASGLGIDPSEGMLDVGRAKIRQKKLTTALTLATGTAETIPLDNDSVDVVTISFGIRNVGDVPAGLSEMYRVLRPGGRALILEFSLPTNRVVRAMYLFYFRHILPRLGGLISGDSYAYNYLNQTVETFPYGDTFCGLMREAGFSDVTQHRLTLGIASIYCGDKKAQPHLEKEPS